MCREKLNIDYRKIIVFYIYEILAYNYGFEKSIINTLLALIIMFYYLFILDREMKNKMEKIFEEIFYILVFIGLILIIIL
ncbi:hypothetical protein [uncultured Clostridium sp.]|uniref:hypothetical protein n=1 Tax=uncultured Clostridium sp. TaxID=59620 RepID=UPI0025D4C6CF|nr:hypothetical protein [uncultured Clostridium sp.]